MERENARYGVFLRKNEHFMNKNERLVNKNKSL